MLGRITLPDYAEHVGPPLRCVGLVGRELAVLWIQNTGHEWNLRRDGQPLDPAENAEMTVRGTPNDVCRVEWWDTWEGKVTQVTEARSQDSRLIDHPAAIVDRRGDALHRMRMVHGSEASHRFVHSAQAKRFGRALARGELERRDTDGRQTARVVFALSLGEPDHRGLRRTFRRPVPARRFPSLRPRTKHHALASADNQETR